MEMFEDTFTIPLHKFNLNLILSHTKIQNVNETVIMERSIKRLKQKEHVAEIEELQLPTDSMNLETVLPMIDHTEINNIIIKEERKQIVKNRQQQLRTDEIPDLETVLQVINSIHY